MFFCCLFICKHQLLARHNSGELCCHATALVLYVNGSGSITSVGEERANLSAVVYL